MTMTMLRTVLLALALAAPVAVGAQSLPKEKGAARTVKMFDFYCLSRLPDLESIERAAGLGEYDQLNGGDLQPYAPQGAPEQLHGWRFHDQGDAFVLTAYRAPRGADTSVPPAFAASSAVHCDFHISASAPGQILAELTKLLGRAPDKSSDPQAHTWTLQTDKAFSEIRFSLPLAGGKTAVLHARVLLKS
jgi:hypothetical protein